MTFVQFLEKNTRTINRPIIKLYKTLNNSKIFRYIKTSTGNYKMHKFIESHEVKYVKIRTREDYTNFQTESQDIINYAKKFGDSLRHAENGRTIPGFCMACGSNTRFHGTMLPMYSKDPILSETLWCKKCGSANRTRALFYVLYKEFPNKKNLNLYTAEQVTPFYKQLEASYGFYNTVIGSEYLDCNYESGTIHKGIRHEDAMNLSFLNNSLDAVISNHVYEHVTDIDKTLKEAYRVLKTGGKVIAGIPFDINRDKTLVRAKIENNKIIYLAEKEIHGNPLDKDGCLCYYTYGWDLFEKFKNAGFKDTYFINILDKNLGNIVDYPVATFVAIK